MQKCGCGIPAAYQTSWTFQNSGRRFVACKFYNPETNRRGCKFFKWIDEESTDWQRHLINQLLNENRSLKNEVKKPIELEELNNEMENLKNQLENLKKDKKRLKIVLGMMFVVVALLYGNLG